MRTRSSVFVAVSILFVSLIPSVASSADELRPAAEGPAYLDAKLPIGRRVDDLLSRMTLEEKIGQMTQAERGAVAGDPSLIATLRLGSVLSGRRLDADAQHACRLGRDGQRVPDVRR